MLKEEIGRLYVGIPGFFEAFFEDVPGLRLAAMTVLDKCKEGESPMPNAVDENKNESSADANEHQWPRYYYALRRVSIDEMLEGEETTKVVAAPTTLDDGLMEDTVFTQVFDTTWNSACGQERRFLGHMRSEEPPLLKYDGEEQTLAVRGRTQRTQHQQ